MPARKEIIEFGKLCFGSPTSAPWLIQNNWRMVYYLFTSRNHTEAYSKYINWHAKHNAKKAVGGWDLGIGELQFEFLKHQGLSPDDHLLDLGCGSLRGGKYYMGYLNPGNYTGMDISSEVIEEGKNLVGSELLEQASPRFFVNSDLTFEELEGYSFDIVIAQSVFTHLPMAEIEEAFKHLHEILSPSGSFFATFFEPGDHFDQATEFVYEFEELKEKAEAYGLTALDLSHRYAHPRNQRMVRYQIRQI